MRKPPLIFAEGLVKNFGRFEAVKGLNFSIEHGSCVGLLGPNGAGKSTTMRMLMGLSSITTGKLLLFGTPVESLSHNEKARIGHVPQENNFDPDISVEENLKIFGRYFNLSRSLIEKRVSKILNFMHLSEKASYPVNTLSGGMKRRLIIGRSLISDPSLVILDEPTTGLDPQARALIWSKLAELKSEGKTLLLSTHYMDEAQRLCDHVIIIDRGIILDLGTPDDLILRHAGRMVVEVNKPHDVKKFQGQWVAEDTGDTVLYFLEKPKSLLDNFPSGVKYKQRMADLEDVFFRLTGRQLREN